MQSSISKSKAAHLRAAAGHTDEMAELSLASLEIGTIAHSVRTECARLQEHSASSDVDMFALEHSTSGQRERQSRSRHRTKRATVRRAMYAQSRHVAADELVHKWLEIRVRVSDDRTSRVLDTSIAPYTRAAITDQGAA
ncbi:hypothetical protein FVE85_5902 [Porphyridium purpureum]|uniref:Uncharacterized protein n=1 Tax=Porphyridium purpureum TaxID=35688 RepID=A0A5J4Z6N1_PORPP|nr:hypothetical protein FVE85_5902 [Porphyridium purpureum]|eukprot:POR2399..scf295_1